MNVSQNRTFFILGRNAELSILEILSVLHAENISYTDPVASDDVLLLTTASPLPLKQLQSRLGGTIKIGHLLPATLHLDQLPNSDAFFSETILAANSATTGRITFGLSAYTLTRQSKKVSTSGSLSTKLLRTLGLNVKKTVRDAGHSVRFAAVDRESFLSSVSVEKNGLVKEHGCEFVLLRNGNHIFIGITDTVQEFEEYSFRDWSRPHREMETGLLPPKLAQIMINISGVSPKESPTILDPFCGFGTIIQEALLIGFTKILGSDLSEKNVHAAQENIAWLLSKKDLVYDTSAITTHDATKISSTTPRASIDAIITEPYLGPVISQSFGGPLKNIVDTLSALYISFLKEAHTILKPKGVIVMVWPVWMQKDKNIFLPILERVISIGFKNTTISQGAAPLVAQHTSRNTVIYFRAGQHVGRELIRLEKS